jgi:predicted ATPase/DNA-binding SARP family transcriptional activator
MRIGLLGGFEVSEGDRTVAHSAWRLRKAKTLVKLLALEPAHRLHRDQIADQLWPELDPDAARNNLHQALHAARRALSTIGVDGNSALALRDDLVVLGPDDHLVTDVEELQVAIEQATASADGTALVAALRRWHGDLLPEDAFELWAQRHASRIREWRTTLVMRLVEGSLFERDPQTAVALLAPVVADNSLHEPLHRALMRALAGAGRRAEALVLFERLRTVLQQELAAEPEPQTRQLYRELLASSTQDAGSAQLHGPPRAINLPVRVTQVVGRRRELDETAGLLTNARLLTLTGPGGVGKTTLAVELARRNQERFRDGVVLVELAALADGELVVGEVAEALRLQLPTRQAAIDSLVAQLYHRQLLIVLDNCEQVIDACALTVTELLRGCPEISVLATSREPLRVAGEVSWRTPSLALPDPEHLPSLEAMAEIASLRLFVQRASAAAPGFALADDNATAVAEICFRLDGMPLALELAAACIPVLSPQQIVARLGDALALLSRGSRATITRQQTLAATLEWSHNLLVDDERVLLRRLAVFAGSFTLEAVEGVCAEDPEQAQVLGALGRLVDTSLVLAESRDDITRYRLLETVRQYATERLRAAGEEATIRNRHCDWYVAFAEARDPEVSSSIIEVAPASLDVEHGNLRVALAWAVAHEPPTALRLAAALWRYWLARSLFAEGCHWLETVLAAVPEPSVMRGRGLLALAVFELRRGSAQRLAQIGAETIAAHRALSDRSGLALALHADGVLAYMRGQWSESWQRGLEAREAASEGGVHEVEASTAHLRAMVLLGRGELTPARVAFEQARAALTKVPQPKRPFFIPMMLGFAVEGAGTASPRLYFEETVLTGPRVNAGLAQGYVLCNLAYLARLAGDLAEARVLVEESISIFTTLGDRDGEALAVNHLGCLHRVQAEYGASRAALERSLRLRQDIGDRRAIGLTLAGLGVLTAAEGDPARGLEMLEQALVGFRETEDAPGRVGTSLTIASVYADAGDYDRARRLFGDVLEESRHIPGSHRATAWGYSVLSDVHHCLGESEEAARALSQARDLFRALGAVDGTVVRDGKVAAKRS